MFGMSKSSASLFLEELGVENMPGFWTLDPSEFSTVFNPVANSFAPGIPCICIFWAKADPNLPLPTSTEALMSLGPPKRDEKERSVSGPPSAALDAY